MVEVPRPPALLTIPHFHRAAVTLCMIRVGSSLVKTSSQSRVILLVGRDDTAQGGEVRFPWISVLCEYAETGNTMHVERVVSEVG